MSDGSRYRSWDRQTVTNGWLSVVNWGCFMNRRTARILAERNRSLCWWQQETLKCFSRCRPTWRDSYCGHTAKIQLMSLLHFQSHRGVRAYFYRINTVARRLFRSTSTLEQFSFSQWPLRRSLTSWMAAHKSGAKTHTDKTGLVWTGSRYNLCSLRGCRLSLQLGCDTISPNNGVWLLAVTIVADFSFDKHVSNVCMMCFSSGFVSWDVFVDHWTLKPGTHYSFKRVLKKHPFERAVRTGRSDGPFERVVCIGLKSVKTLVHAFVGSRVD